MTSPLTNQNALIAMVRDDIPVEIVEDIQERSSATPVSSLHIATNHHPHWTWLVLLISSYDTNLLIP